MKILIITEDVGKTAPGIVFERLIKGLSIQNEVSVLTASLVANIDLSGVQNVIISNRLDIHPRIYKLLIGIFGVNPYDLYWAIKSIHIFKKKVSINIDIVMSFLSYHHYSGLIAGKMYCAKENIKHVVYSVDGIPAPGWPENKMYFNGVKRLIKRYLSNVDALFSGNQQMLSYQLLTFIPSKKIIAGVINYPSNSVALNVYAIPQSGTNNFVYTGGIYTVRKADYIIAGFQKLLKIYPESKLQFIGSHLSPALLSSLDDSVLKKIEVIPYTKNLDPFYKESTALIDIDADMENDIFLSSKMSSYLMINRIIISETGLNSPSRHLFKGISSIIQCEHNADQLYNAMKSAIEMKETITFDDRTAISQLFTIENIIGELTKSLESLLS